MTTEELSQDEIKKIYKDLMHYRLSDNFKEICEEGNKAGEKLLEDIQKEFKTRKLPKMEYSEANKLNVYINFYSGVLERVDDSEGGKKFKEEINKQIQNGLSHLYNKVEIGFDAPMFTKLDLLKVLRTTNLTIDKKLDEIINEFTPKQEEETSNHPYEE